VNLAPQAQASTNSEAVAWLQTADKAIDRVIDGWPNDYTKEWVTEDPIHLGGWLKLTWSSPVTVDEIVLYDRKIISNEHITAGRIDFSDGTSLTVGPLNDDGTATSVRFAAKTITSLTFTITAMGPLSHDVGLMEIEVFGFFSGNQGAGQRGSAAPGDINADGRVDLVDLAILLNNWGTPSDPRADLTTARWISLIILSGLRIG